MAVWKSRYTLRLFVITVLCVAGVTSLLTIIHASGQLAPAQQTAPAMGGTYRGNVTVDEPAPLGALTLALGITNTNGTLKGEVDPTQTMVFLGGPRFTGTFKGGAKPTFRIDSETFTSVVSKRTVQRKFTLTGEVIEKGNTLKGTYVETISGFTPEPMVVKGTFLLVRPLDSQIVLPPQVGGTPTVTPIVPKPATPVTPGSPPTKEPGSSDQSLRLPAIMANPIAESAQASPEPVATPVPPAATPEAEETAKPTASAAAPEQAPEQATPGHRIFLPVTTKGE